MVGPQRGQGYADLVFLEFPHQGFHQLLNAGMVGAGKGGQGNLIVAGICFQGPGLIGQGFGGALPYRPVNHAGLAKAAAPGAAAQHFQHHAVMDDLDVGDQRLFREDSALKLFQPGFFHPGRRGVKGLD